MVVVKHRRTGKHACKFAKAAMMFGFVEMQVNSAAMEIIPMDILMYFFFCKGKKKHKQTENR